MRPVTRLPQYTNRPFLAKLQSKEVKLYAGITGIIAGIVVFVPMLSGPAKDPAPSK
ncbi:hypothetical protein HDU77_006366 [Chytriomyces hyalinus]|nr:hypothetical protein HDU77_006366 [Chytriomyces hyalinus]